MRNLIATLTFVMLLCSQGFTQPVPVNYNTWSLGDGRNNTSIGGERLSNYQLEDDSWGKSIDSFVVTIDSAYSHRHNLKTTVYADGRTRIRVRYDGQNFDATSEVIGIGWINKSTWAYSWIDNSMDFSSVSVDTQNVVTFTGVSPGVDYRVRQQNAGVEKGIFFKPGFLDSAVVLYDQRADSLDIGLANVMRYTFTNIPDGDSAVGDVGTDGRKLKQLGRKSFNIAGNQHLFFPGWDGYPTINVRQYWRRIGASLYCVEWVPMRRIKQVHEALPSATLWHNDNNLIDGADVSDCIIRNNYNTDSVDNFGTNTTLDIKPYDDGNVTFGLINFDYSEIAASVTVEQVDCTLGLYLGNGKILYWYQMTKTWLEGSQNNAIDSAGACWAWSGVPSGNAGRWTYGADGSYNTSILDSTTNWDVRIGNDWHLTHRSGDTVAQGNEMATYIEGCINGDSTNAGFLLKGASGQGTAGVYSINYSNTAARPRMGITWTAVAGGDPDISHVRRRKEGAGK